MISSCCISAVNFYLGLLGPLSGPVRMKLSMHSARAQSGQTDGEEEDYDEDYQNGEMISLHLTWEVRAACTECFFK
jgi:hypothetical protein